MSLLGRGLTFGLSPIQALCMRAANTLTSLFLSEMVEKLERTLSSSCLITVKVKSKVLVYYSVTPIERVSHF